MMRKASVITFFAFCSAICIAQVPSGSHAVADQSPQDAVRQSITQAEEALEKQDYKGAEIKLKELATANPNDGRVLYDLGFAEERNGEEAEAARAYAASITAIPGFAEPQIALGLLDARTGHTTAAHRELLAVANLQTATPQLRARAFRALAHLDEAHHAEDAREDLLAALKLTPETPDDVLMGAELAELAGDPADAEVAYRRALKLMPGDVDATAGLAHALQKQGKVGEADTILATALKQHPDDVRLIAQAATLYAAEDKEAQAIPLLEQLRASNPTVAADPETTQLLAQMYYLSGDNAAAEKLYTTLLTVTPNNPVLLDALGSAQVKQGRDAEAESTFEKAVAQREAFHDDQAWAEAAGHLAFAASKNNDPTVCLQALSARAAVLPNSPTSLFLEATAYDHLHHLKEAIASYQAFLKLANGTFPDQEFEARHRIIALQHDR
ncbi:MAG: tetratricopeptide repeat protein [Acidobacteria bacterium]|nr:tetratricopeptide repeat protein [Acidobacteriota bacterium]